MRLIFGIAVASMLLLATAAADKEPEPDPTFRPGAKVSLELTVKAPKGWELNYLLPIEVVFDEKQLKKAPFTVEKSSLSFKLKEYTEQAVLKIPLELKPESKPGEIAIPFDLDYSICELESDHCTFSVQDIEIPLKIESTAPKGSKSRALKAGSLPATIQLPPGTP